MAFLPVREWLGSRTAQASDAAPHFSTSPYPRPGRARELRLNLGLVFLQQRDEWQHRIPRRIGAAGRARRQPAFEVVPRAAFAAPQDPVGTEPAAAFHIERLRGC